MSYGTLPSRFLHAVDSLPNPRAQLFRRDATWHPISSAELLRRVAGLSMALVELGVKPGDRVAVFATNRPEWHTADFAITGAGGITVPIYFNESTDRMTYILNHSAAKVIVVAGGGPNIPNECLQYETLIASASDVEVAAYRLRAGQVLPGQLASVIYTSGTTGEPKGVMLTHTNICSNITDSCVTTDMNPGLDSTLSFLPLAHIYGRTMDYVMLCTGISIAYVEDVNELSKILLEIKPTVLAAVPRVFEKMYARILEKGTKNTGTKRKLFDWGMDVAKRSAKWRCGTGSASPWLKLQWAVADKLVYSKIRQGTGGNLRIVFSGGAPLSRELAEFFWSIGINIYQGYGLTETSPVLTSNYPKNRVGSSGRPIANVLISIAPDGEILAKGPCVMQGYYKSPDATREVLTEDGWFHTGDIGYLDPDNSLFTPDR